MVNSIRKYILQFQEIYIHLCGKNEKLFGHFLGSNVENTPDYVEISVVNKINNKAFQINVPKKSEMKSTLKCYPQFKLLNRMHIVFPNFDICLTFSWYFFLQVFLLSII